jgi:hypothetical protein
VAKKLYSAKGATGEDESKGMLVGSEGIFAKKYTCLFFGEYRQVHSLTRN